MPRPLPVATVAQIIEATCDNGHGLQPETCEAPRRLYLFPKALSKVMGKDGIRRLFDFI